jgi:hypothetical protein
MTEPIEPTAAKTQVDAVERLATQLLTGLVKDSQDKGFGATPVEKIRSLFKDNTSGDTLAGITALSEYLSAHHAGRQATALETIAKEIEKSSAAGSSEVAGQAIIDARVSKREALASEHSLPSPTLSLLWALRGIVVDAAIRALSRPDRFDPYPHVTTEEMAWTFRVTPEAFWEMLPRNSGGDIDYSLLEAFDILHYGGTDEYPDAWMYGG